MMTKFLYSNVCLYLLKCMSIHSKVSACSGLYMVKILENEEIMRV